MSLTIAPGRAVLLVVDIQERLAAAMPSKVMAQTERNTLVLIEMARRLSVPVVVSQQYPKGLGATVPAIEDALEHLDAHRFDKLAFSACAAPDFPAVRRALEPWRSQWIVAGMEAHVCVYQTVRDLVAAGQHVQVPRDAVVSRARSNWEIGLGLIERAGGIVTSTETVVFDALGRAGTEDFKALSRLMK